MIQLKRAYEKPSRDDGLRVLVDRLWPRGSTAAPEPVVSLASCQPVSLREKQLLAYVRWATLSERGGVRQFEKGSSLAGYHEHSYSSKPLMNDDAATVDHNPSPSML
jgi:hypothetical protein